MGENPFWIWEKNGGKCQARARIPRECLLLYGKSFPPELHEDHLLPLVFSRSLRTLGLPSRQSPTFACNEHINQRLTLRRHSHQRHPPPHLCIGWSNSSNKPSKGSLPDGDTAPASHGLASFTDIVTIFSTVAASETAGLGGGGTYCGESTHQCRTASRSGQGVSGIQRSRIGKPGLAGS